MCVQDVDVQCALQFTLIHAASCALHRRTSRVIHRIELSDLLFGVRGPPKGNFFLSLTVDLGGSAGASLNELFEDSLNLSRRPACLRGMKQVPLREAAVLRCCLMRAAAKVHPVPRRTGSRRSLKRQR